MKSTAAVAAALVLSGYAPTAVTSEQVDVSFAFLSYTQDYCSGGVAVRPPFGSAIRARCGLTLSHLNPPCPHTPRPPDPNRTLTSATAT